MDPTDYSQYIFSHHCPPSSFLPPHTPSLVFIKKVLIFQYWLRCNTLCLRDGAIWSTLTFFSILAWYLDRGSTFSLSGLLELFKLPHIGHHYFTMFWKTGCCPTASYQVNDLNPVLWEKLKMSDNKSLVHISRRIHIFLRGCLSSLA